ncbi:MAG: hypothetical protein EXS42_07380 [Lacunisphaera sp.]|nr:hypothetical protein [Lacunisphaera sp.]
MREGRAGSVSAIIRAALAQYDFANVVVLYPAKLQISVRLPAAIRKNLRKISRAKHTSVGQLVRAVVEAYLPSIETPAGPGDPAIPEQKNPPRRGRRARRGRRTRPTL